MPDERRIRLDDDAPAIDARDPFGRIVTASRDMADVCRRAAMAARVDLATMIVGERGTGKELIARAMHASSPRAARPFVVVDCAAFSPDVTAHLLFGRAETTPDPAERPPAGLLAEADGGTLFLDEILELDVASQTRLVEALDRARTRRPGGPGGRDVDARILAATSRDPGPSIARGAFRRDLLARVSTLELRVPPLRRRPGDVPVLVDHFARRHADADHREIRVTEKAMAVLESWTWPGNVRELEQVVVRAGAVARISGRERIIDVSDLAPLLTPGVAPPGTADAARDQSPASAASPAGATLDVHERALIEDALARAEGNKSKASRLLGIHRNSLARRMARLGIG